MVGIEYDGDQHRSDRRQYVKDITRQEMLEGLGWLIIRVVSEDHPDDIIRRVREALSRRKEIEDQGRAMAALITRTALMIPSSRLPSLNDATAAATPRSAADSTPRPLSPSP